VKTPIEMMLDGVTWTEAEQQPNNHDGLPWATHEGVLDIAGHKLHCYRLNTGQAIFNADDIHAFFGDTLSANA
jgi:hypothetical protein